MNDLTAQKQSKSNLPAQLKANIEAMSGFSMDDVRVHYNSSKPAQMKALAYTQGTDIHVGPGQEKHLGHEAWHVVQQKQGRVAPTAQLKGVNVNTDEALEHEADVMGARASVFSAPASPVVQRKTDSGAQGATVQFGKTKEEKEEENNRLAQQIKDTGAVKNVDLRGFDPEFSESALKAITEAKNDFGDLEINYFGSIQNQNEGLRQIMSNEFEKAFKVANGDKFTDEQYKRAADHKALNKMNALGLYSLDDTIARSLDTSDSKYNEYTGIAVNDIYSSDNAKFNLKKEDEVRAKHKPVGCGTSKATVDHELGHEIDKLVNASGDPDINKWYTEMMDQNEEYAKDNLSGYSRTSVKEFIAEAYSEYRNNEKPRKYAIDVYSKLKQLYNEKKENEARSK